jgi:uncharacterized delta-60 repeat protein
MHKAITFLTFFLFPTLMYKPRDMLVQPDNKFIVASDVTVVIGDTAYISLIRYNSNGTIDNTFGTNGKVTTGFDGGLCGVKALTLQADGKIVAVGFFNRRVNGISQDIDFAVLRYNSNGTLDTSFDADGRVTTDFGSTNDVAHAVAIQSDGKIVVAGDSKQSGKIQTFLARYNPNGALDASFNGIGKLATTMINDVNDRFITLAIVDDNKIMLGKRTFTDYGQIQVTGTQVIRYNSDGNLDTSFGGGGRVSEVGSTPIHRVFKNGKMLVANNIFRSITGGGFKLKRFDQDGKIDATFGINGEVTTDFTQIGVGVTDILEQKDGKIVVSGIFSGVNPTDIYSFGLVRYKANGTLDSTFGTNGKTILLPTLTSETYIRLGIQSDGKILYCGGYTQEANKSNIVVARFNNTIVSVKNVQQNTPLSIFPNPTTNVLNIDFKKPITDVLKVTITDISGRLVYQQNYDKGLINSNLQINSQDFMAGLYIVNIVSDKENISQMIVKQ